jgi:hypothetical protein
MLIYFAFQVITLSKVRKLMEDFLALKRETGTAMEQSLYEKMTVEQFVTRLFVCRPYVFINSNGEKIPVFLLVAL